MSKIGTAIQDLIDQRNAINQAINDLTAFREYGGRYTAGNKTAEATDIKAQAKRGGVNIDAWDGEPD